MGVHALGLLIIKPVPIFTFLLLWQLGFDFGFGEGKPGLRRTGNPCGYAGYNRTGKPCDGDYGRSQPGIYGRESFCSQDDGLPCKEVDALQTVMISLGLLPLPSITRSYCQDADSFLTCSCTSNVCHITKIRMEGKGLSGFIPEYVSYLTYLETLDLSGNNLGGIIPDSLGDIRNLITLDLANNRLTGPIPKSLGKLQSLTGLTLSLNFLNGEIPPSLGNLSSLVNLDLWSNNLIGGIPNDLGKLSKLQTLRLDDNQLSGPLPAGLGRLSNLTQLWLTSNNLNGSLESGNFSQLIRLQSFAVGGNNLSGQIPNYYKNWNNLRSLILLGNNFEGGLPQEIFNMTSLQYLWVSDLNNSNFSIPDSANLTSIYSLILRNCSIYGPIPKSTYTWSWLTHLDLSFNSLTGEILSKENLTSLNKMFLTRNMLTGEIPGWINERSIKGDLSYNNFTVSENRKINMSNLAPNKRIINMPSLDQMREKNCNGSKSKYHSLFINSGGEEAIVDGNHYHSDKATSNYYESPKGNWAYSCSGDFMSSKATVNDYIKNTTCGISFSQENLYKNARLCPQSITYYGFCLQNGNYTVQLHFAEIVYTKDEDHSSTGKRVFDVYIQGERKLQDFNIKENADQSFHTWVHNNQLEIHLFWAGKGSLYNPPALNGPLISAISVTKNFKAGGLSAWMIAVITVGSVFTLVLSLALLWRMGLVGKSKLYGEIICLSFNQEKIEIQGKYYSLKQLTYATRKFSPKMEIHKGIFGAVYKAELPDQTVAVEKVSTDHSKQVIDQLRTEVYVLKLLKQENLIELLASYSRQGLHLLIYEYMEHHSLKDALLGFTVVLPWEVRYDICLGVAKGLKYLHERTPSVIHRNIKSANVLLDGTFKAKISNFGFAQLFEEENPFSFIGKDVALAYMAPEYATGRAMTNKVDVYSFGVVVLEIVSGREAADKQGTETVFLLDMAWVSHAKGRFLDLVDKKLSTYDRKQVITVLNLAMICIDQSPSLRPTMSEVVDVLESYKTIEQISKVATPSA